MVEPIFQRSFMAFRSLMEPLRLYEDELVALYGILFWNERNLLLVFIFIPIF